MRGRGRFSALLAATVAALAIAPPALADFPFTDGNPNVFSDLYDQTTVPDDACGDGNQFKFAASADPTNTLINVDPVELDGVRGAHVFDGNPATSCDNDQLPTSVSNKPTGFKQTTGRPDVEIAVLDSGIKWNDFGAMQDLRLKIHLNRGELPLPKHSDSSDCASYDCNGDGVFNVADYSDDPRVDLSDPRRVGPGGVLVPQDLIIAFSDGTDGDSNGYVDDIAGWDFLDNDNDPFDDVQYGHGTGEARDSSSEANNGGQMGSCPNCMVMPLRVGDSFVADVNRFGAAVLYASDNGVDVVQEALGALNNSRFAREAVEYAYRHGVTIIASAADEAAQHNNWPSTMPHVIVVNSVTKSDIADGQPNPISYLALNGCTNFSAKITLAIPSTSCSSNATGLASGMAGLIYSAALDAKDKGKLLDYPDASECQRTNGDPCVITPNEVRQVMASGTINGTSQADDVDFAGTPAGSNNEPSCSPVPAPNCTDPNAALQTQVNTNRPALVPASKSYPARKGPDAFYGYGRANMDKAVSAIFNRPNLTAARVPPEAEITSPEWFEQVDPSKPSLEIDGQVFARNVHYTCEVLVAPGQYPNNARATAAPPGDFSVVGGNGWCNGSQHDADHSGALATITLSQLESRFPPGTDFTGSEPVPNPNDGSGRPFDAPHSFTVEVLVHSTQNGVAMTGADRRAAFLHRDQAMLDGFPRHVNPGPPASGDGESSPAFADLNGDNRNELIYASSDGYVHAIERDGSELPGWPVKGDVPGIVSAHTGSRAYQSGEVPSNNIGGAIVGSVAVGDTNGDGVPEVYAADLEGKVYGWNPQGQRVFTEESTPAFSGKPLHPFENVRYDASDPDQSNYRRTQHGFIASPVLADLDGDGRQELILAGMDRHVYAWETNDSDPSSPDGAPQASGFPVLVVDPSKVLSIDRDTNAVTFKPDANALMQGAIIDTPALADISGNARPELVVGTNEEYEEPLNSGNVTTATFPQLGATGLLNPGNGRVYALKPGGDADNDPMTPDDIVTGWPFALGIIDSELLPVVGEGVVSGPVVASVTCPSGGSGPKIGVLANNGPAYILNANGTSCYGNDPGNHRPNALESDFSPSGTEQDHPTLPAVGLGAFGDLGGPQASFLTPVAGAIRALDVAAPEYQGGQDFIGAWDSTSSQFHAGFPAPVNDLQFLTGPAVGDIDGVPGQEVVEGSASFDLAAYSAAGTPVSGWPKLSTDWTVTVPLIGSFGTLDTNPTAKKVVVGETRSGYINAYATPAPACSASSSPRFHHDNANSGDFSRDAVLPGKPFGASATSTKISFQAPGDDLLCGTADHYEIATSADKIDEGNFDQADSLSGAPAPKAAGSNQSYTPPTEAKRFVAIRAVDDQGNVGRVMNIEFRKPPPPPPPPKACSNRIEGTGGDDVLRGTHRGDRILAKAGDDRVAAHGGADCLAGNGGRDKLRGGKGNDHIADGAGKDRDRGGGDDDVIDGGSGRDHVFGSGGDDQIDVAGGGQDDVECGSGNDTVHADSDDTVAADCEVVN
jgi:hypothetical protein